MNELDQYYPLIGKVVVKFQHLDLLLNTMMTALLREDPNVTMAYTVSLPFAKKIDIIKAISSFKFKYKDLCDELDGAIKLLSKAEEERNRIIHATWIESSGGDSVFFHKPQTSRKHGLKNSGIRQAGISELEASLSVIEQATSTMLELCRKLETRRVIKAKTFT